MLGQTSIDKDEVALPELREDELESEKQLFELDEETLGCLARLGKPMEVLAGELALMHGDGHALRHRDYFFSNS